MKSYQQQEDTLNQADRQALLNQSGGDTITSTENLEELATILNERMLTKAGGNNQRLAIMMGMLTKEQTIKANIPSYEKSQFSQERYKFFLDAEFEISNICCNVMKKEPIHRYYKQTGRVGITAQMASESRLRTQQWLNNGCNAFNNKYPISNPMSFWVESDVLLYIYLNKLPICEEYGEVVIDYESMGQAEGQTNLFEYDQANLGLFDTGRLLLKTTKVQRTGCFGCLFAAHNDKKGCGRFLRMKQEHPSMYNALFNGGRFEYTIKDKNGSEVNIKHVDRDILERWYETHKDDSRYLITRTWKPYRGFGYKYIVDWINEHLNKKIEY